MYRLIKTKDAHTLEIGFDRAESIDVLGPFRDIVTGYAAESGVDPQEVDWLFNYKFRENGSQIQFYWNNGFTIYVFYIGSAQYQSVYGRLSRICADLNKQLKNRKPDI